MKIDYGFQILPEKEIEKILQNGNKCSYRGYIDEKGIPQGVGIESFDYGLSHIG